MANIEEPNETPDNVEDLAADLENAVECLSFLSTAIESPAVEFQGGPGGVSDYSSGRPIHVHYSEIIRSKFPRAKDALIERLAEISWDRYQHICRERIKEQTKESKGLPIFRSEESKPQFPDLGLENTAYRAQNMSSLQAETMTVISTRAESSHKRLPTLPAEARAGKPFTCDVCYQVVDIRRTRAWK